MAALGLRVLPGLLDLADGRDDRRGSSPPVRGPNPAPGHDVGQGEQRFRTRSPVFVDKRAAGRAPTGELEQLVTVCAQERVVLFDDEHVHVMARGREIVPAGA